MARRLGATAEQLAALERSDYSEFDPAWASALAYAEAMTPTGGRVDDETFAALAAHWTAGQIVEITAVVSLFNYFNRFAEALAIPVTR